MTKAMMASPAVTLMFPVADAPYGMRPSRFIMRMKKNVVSRYGMYFSPPVPMLGIATSSRRKTTTISKRFPNPVGTGRRAFFRRDRDRDDAEEKRGNPEEDDVLRDRHVDRHPGKVHRGELRQVDSAEGGLQHPGILDVVEQLGEIHRSLFAAVLRGRVERLRAGTERVGGPVRRVSRILYERNVHVLIHPDS